MTQSPANTPLSPAGPPPAPGGQPATPRFTPVDPLRLLRKYKYVFLATAVLGVLAGAALFIALKRYAPTYQATAFIRVQPELKQPYAIGGPDLPQEDQYLRLKRTQAAYIMSSENINDAVTRVQDSAWYRSLAPGSAVNTLEEMVSVQLGDSELMSINVSAADPATAKLLVDAVVNAHVERMDRIARQSRNEVEQLFVDRRLAIEDQIASVRERMGDIMNRTRYDTTANNLEEIEVRFESLVSRRIELEQQLKSAARNLEGLRQSIAQDQLEPTPSELDQVNQSPIINSLNQRILGLKEELRVRRDQFGESHRSVRDIKRRLQAAEIERETEREQRLARLQEMKLDNAEAGVSAIQAAYNDVAEQLDQVRQERRDLRNAMRPYEQYQSQLARLQESLGRTSDLLTSMELVRSHPSAVQVARVGQTELPEEPTFPKVQTIVPGVTFLFLAAVGGLVFLREMLDSRIKTPACTQLLPECDTLGVIPEAQDDPDGAGSFDLVVARNPAGLLAENFRQLRTEVVQRMQRHRFKTMMVVGCQPRGGVTAITANLAASIALNERRVLVIDANFRRPAQHESFGLAKSPGLADILAGAASVDDAIQATDVDKLDVMPIGDADNRLIERLESNAFTQALRACEERYDLILIDAPPLSIVGDSRVLANRVDAVLLTVRALREKRGMVGRLMNQLKAARAEFLGLVINGVRASAGGYYKRNFEAFYEYQNGSEDSRRRPAAERTTRRGRRAAAEAAESTEP